MATKQRVCQQPSFISEPRSEYRVKPLPKTQLKIKLIKSTELSECAVLGYN